MINNDVYRQIYAKIQAAFIGGLYFALIGLAIAQFDIVFSGPGHPHGMPSLMYFIMPMFSSPLGALLGMILSIRLKNKALNNIACYLAASSLMVFLLDIILHLVNFGGLFITISILVTYIYG